jgi:4'-phosphopantetheinyl transferase
VEHRTVLNETVLFLSLSHSLAASAFALKGYNGAYRWGLRGQSMSLNWEIPAAPVALEGDRVHLWLIDTRRIRTQIDTCAAVLGTDESARARRFRMPDLSARFVLAHGAVRHILGMYVDADPRQLRFTHNAYGKPALQSHPIHFNLSYADHLALLAVAHHRRVGVDIERARVIPEMDDLVARWFSTAEKQEWMRLKPEQKLRGFYNGWTRKEAVIKATGKGLSQPLDAFSVTLNPGSPARLVHGTVDMQRLQVVDIGLGEDYVAALAVEGSGFDLAKWQWVE